VIEQTLRRAACQHRRHGDQADVIARWLEERDEQQPDDAATQEEVGKQALVRAPAAPRSEQGEEAERAEVDPEHTPERLGDPHGMLRRGRCRPRHGDSAARVTHRDRYPIGEAAEKV
jgi:hypothetical protein